MEKENVLKWSTEKRKVNDLFLFDINPRTISDEKKKALELSLDKFNLVEIPVVDTNNKIIAGNQRALIMQLVGRGEEEIDVRVPNRPLTDAEFKEYAIISNTHAGEFDFDMLDMHFKEINIDDLGFDLPDFNFNKPKNTGEGEEDDFEFPDVVETDIVEGDLFEIGKHRLLCGDSTVPETWEKLCGEHRFDLVVTDPPYNVNYEGKTKDALKIKNDKMGQSQFYDFLFAFYSSLAAYTKLGGVWYIWHADSEGHNFRQAFLDAGMKLAQTVIWKKNSMVMGRQDYHWQHEPCLYGWKEGAAHGWYSDRKQTTIMEFDRPFRNAEHPTMKPVPLIAYQINNSSKTGDIVADGFGGSGTTMVAGEQLGRRVFMMELDVRYAQVIVDRMIKLVPGIVVTKNGQPYGDK